MENEEQRIREMMEFYSKVKSPMDDFDYYQAAVESRPTPIPQVYLEAFREEQNGK
jgi:hypothetical protein